MAANRSGYGKPVGAPGPGPPVEVAVGSLAICGSQPHRPARWRPTRLVPRPAAWARRECESYASALNEPSTTSCRPGGAVRAGRHAGLVKIG